tara:strand:+ start:49991 stop:50347 length:357 start_codon:yes stop_codon:yes gene_type:complete
MNSKMIYSLAALAIAVYAIGFLRSDFQEKADYRVSWQLVDGQLIDGPKAIVLDQGKRLILVVHSNRPEQLKLQGYDETLQLKPNTPQELYIPLSKSGHFRLELLPHGILLGTLDVKPN